jgi:hypothetical protein
MRFLPASPAVILDIGGGPGGHACWLARHGYEVHLLDLSPLHVEMATVASNAPVGTTPRPLKRPKPIWIRWVPRSPPAYRPSTATGSKTCPRSTSTHRTSFVPLALLKATTRSQQQ